MKTRFHVGIFFLALALVFALAARSDYLASQRHWLPVGKTRGRIAIVFAIVGGGLLVSWLLRRRQTRGFVWIFRSKNAGVATAEH